MKEKLGAGQPPFRSLPLLVYHYGKDTDNRQTMFDVSDRTLHTRVVPELSSGSYWPTSRGWVFIKDPESLHNRTRLWNPQSGEEIALPAMEQDVPDRWDCILSGDPAMAPASSACVVLLQDKRATKFLYCHVGGSRWFVHEYDLGDVILPDVPPRKQFLGQLAAVNGKFYFKETSWLGVIEFAPTPVISYLDLYGKFEFPEGMNGALDNLVASPEELFVVYVFVKGFSPEIGTVHVYKIDLSAEPALRKVDSIGDMAFLLSDFNVGALCSPRKYGLKGNHVYLMHNMTEEPDGGWLHMFNLDDATQEILQPCHHMPEVICSPFWMLPSCSD